MVVLRAFLLAFPGASAWFVWAVSNQTSGSCFGGGHYVPSAAVALSIVVALDVALEVSLRSPRRGMSNQQPTSRAVAGGAITTAALMAAGLLIGGFFAAVVSCSA